MLVSTKRTVYNQLKKPDFDINSLSALYIIITILSRSDVTGLHTTHIFGCDENE